MSCARHCFDLNCFTKVVFQKYYQLIKSSDNLIIVKKSCFFKFFVRLIFDRSKFFAKCDQSSQHRFRKIHGLLNRKSKVSFFVSFDLGGHGKIDYM
jgi:hypothetical protein